MKSNESKRVLEVVDEKFLKIFKFLLHPNVSIGANEFVQYFEFPFEIKQCSIAAHSTRLIFNYPQPVRDLKDSSGPEEGGRLE